MSAAQTGTVPLNTASSDLVTKVFTVRIKGTVDAVWNEITKTDEVQKVMFNMKLDATMVPGERLRLTSPDGKYTNIIGEVLACEPKQLYAHTFKFTSYEEAACRVTHELQEDGDEVVYKMTCEDMVAGDKTTKQMSQGGDMIAANLKAIVETGKLPFGTRALYTLFAMMAPFAPAKLKSENWQ